MPATLTLARYFYRSIFLLNITMGLVNIYMISVLGFEYLATSFYFKLMGYGATVFVKYYMPASGKNTYFYYRNAGVSMRKIYLLAFAFDLLLYILMVICFYLYTHGHTNPKS